MFRNMRKVLLLIGGLLVLLFIDFGISKEVPMNSSIYTGIFYVEVSDKIMEGILFTNSTGSLENKQYPLIAGTRDNNATWNYNSTSSQKKTSYWIKVSGREADICHRALQHLCVNNNCSEYFIDVGNVSWSASFLNDQDNPSLKYASPLSLNFQKVSENVKDVEIFLRYWLDVPPGAEGGNYTTLYEIKIVPAGESCE